MKMRTTSSRAMTWLGLVMLMLSLTPVGLEVAAAQHAGLPVAEGDVAQGEGSFLEVHVSECEPGTTGTAEELRDTCHANGLAGVTMTVTSVDPALGISQDKTTEQPDPNGPGIINTGTIPGGEYEVAVDLPAEGNTFVVGCEFFDREETHPVTLDDAATFRVNVPQGEDIVCDLYVIPAQEQGASFTFDVTTCERADLPGDGRTFEDLSPNCTNDPEEPITLTLVRPDGTTVEEEVDDEGQVTFTGLPDGDYGFFSDVPVEDGADYLFCEYEGQPRYEKEFNENGVTTFVNMLGEQVECDWFVVYAGEAPAATTAPTATVAPTETTAPTVPPPTEEVVDPTVPPTEEVVDPTAVSPTEVPTATASESLNDQPPADIAAVEGTATLLLHVNTCDLGYDPTGADFETFLSDCPNRTPGVGFTVQHPSGSQLQGTTDAEGNVAFTGLLGDYGVYSGVPLEAATEYLFCSVDGGPVYQKDFSTSGVTSFTNFLPDETVECSWFIAPQNLRGEQTGSTVTVHLSACPPNYQGSDLFNDCHGNGVGDMPFTLSGVATELTANTVVETTPGPGVVNFTSLPAGEYTLAGGPPQDFGRVELYCSDPATSEQIDATMEGGIARFSLGEQQSILCDWYFIGDDAQGDVTPTPAPTEVPQRAEILVTMFECDPNLNTAGATFGDLDRECAQPVNEVPVTLGVPGGVPLSADTGASGDGAVRFFELRPGDYVMTPQLPSGYENIAVYCQIGDGDVYQKPIQGGSTTFVNVEGEQIACSWFVVARQPAPAPEEPAGPTGSITIREFLCEGDAGSIQDWERECVPGTTGTAYTLSASDGSLSESGTPDDNGVLVFEALPDGYYELDQETGVWCRAAAERVDNRSRVIVSGGQNTDVFLYQCNQSIDLPNTGSGATLGGHDASGGGKIGTLMLGMLAVPLFAAAFWQHRRVQKDTVVVPSRTRADIEPIRPSTGRMRFR